MRAFPMYETWEVHVQKQSKLYHREVTMSSFLTVYISYLSNTCEQVLNDYMLFFVFCYDCKFAVILWEDVDIKLCLGTAYTDKSLILYKY